MQIYIPPERLRARLTPESIAAKVQRAIDAGKSQIYIAGFLDELEGTRSRFPPKPYVAELSISQLDSRTVSIAGATYRYKHHFRRLGGKWSPDLQAWLFPIEAVASLHSDPELNESRDLWSGVAPHDFSAHLAAWDKMHDEYMAGSVAAQEIIQRFPKEKTTFTRAL